MKHLFPGDLMFQVGAGSPPPVFMAPGATFGMWSAETGGTDYSSLLTAPDGVTPLTPVADSNGLRPTLRGPDTLLDGTEVTVLWCDTGLTDRFPVHAEDAIEGAIALIPQVADILVQLTALQNTVNGLGTGGGLPVGTTLDQIPDGATRLAFSLIERQKLNLIQDGATKLLIGTTAGTAKDGAWIPTPAQIGAVRDLGGASRVWGRVIAQGFPTAAEGAVDGDWLFMDAS